MGALFERRLKMRRAIIIIAVLFGGPVWALTYMGSPASNVKQGELFLGFDYSSGQVDYEFSNSGVRGILDNVDSDLCLGRAGLGIFDGFEVFGRFGVSEVENLGNEFAWGLGTRATFIEGDDVSWGALFQYTTLNADDAGYLGGGTLDGDFDVHEYQLAIGPTFNNTIYFGPFIHIIDGDADLVNFGSVDIEQDSEFGVYVGVMWELGNNTNLNIEFQGTDDAKMGAISLVHRFGGPSE